MFNYRYAIVVFAAAAVFAIVAAPANAADEIEAKALACAACHGENGVPKDPNTIPIIWGQQASYLYKQLHDYKNGDRKSAVMAPAVQDISLPDLRKLANYFAAKSWPAPPAATAAAAAPAAIAEKLVQCRLCHQPNFEGGAPAPRLAGLSYDYLAASMKSFAGDERTNNGDMPKFMQALTDGERDAMARYLAGL
jgi:cytochrome c553